MERKILYDIFYYYYNINNSNNNSTKQMNKIKNDKYLRKNRGNTRCKYKTRKVQSGGVDEAELLRLQQNADNMNKMKEQRFPMFKELKRKIEGWCIEKFTPGSADSMKRLEELTKIEKRIESDENNQTVNEDIDKIITEFKEILTLNLQERLEELKKMTSTTSTTSVSYIELNGKIREINDILNKLDGINKKNFTSESKTLFESSKEILKKPEKPGLTERFKQGVSNMGKTVKNAVTSRFSRKKKSDNEDVEKEGTELQELGRNENKSTQESKEATPTEPTQVNNEGRLAKMKTATKEGLAKVGTALSNFRSRFTKKKETNYSPLPNTDDTNANEVSQPQGQAQPQGEGQAGGNKTRKIRQHQYIHEIKQNRTHLFNKEMEIINSIRNFKHGHIDNDNDNTKKQFMRAVKRG